MKIAAIIEAIEDKKILSEFASLMIMLTSPIPDGPYKGIYICVDISHKEAAIARALPEDVEMILITQQVKDSLDEHFKAINHESIPPLTL